MMRPGSAVQTMRRAVRFCSAMKRWMAAWRSTILRKLPRRRCLVVNLAKKPSTALSHDHHGRAEGGLRTRHHDLFQGSEGDQRRDGRPRPHRRYFPSWVELHYLTSKARSRGCLGVTPKRAIVDRIYDDPGDVAITACAVARVDRLVVGSANGAVHILEMRAK